MGALSRILLLSLTADLVGAIHASLELVSLKVTSKLVVLREHHFLGVVHALIELFLEIFHVAVIVIGVFDRLNRLDPLLQAVSLAEFERAQTFHVFRVKRMGCLRYISLTDGTQER